MSGATLSGHKGLRTIGLLAVSLVVLPFVLALAGMTITIATKVAVFALLALGFNVLLGYTGLVSFGHAVFFGGGAYVAALVQLHLAPGSLVLPLLGAMLFGTAMGVILGFLVLRRGGVYFSLLTLAFAAMTFYIVFRWTAVTGGENGLGGLTRPTLLGIDLNDGRAYYILVALIVLLVAILLWRFLDSPVGRVLLAIRENRERTQFLGYEVPHYKMAAFTVSASVSALAGGLFVFTTYFASADLVSVPFSGEILVMTIVGGMHSFLGPAVGALFYVFVRDLLSAYTNSWQLWFGLLFVGFILFSPGGIAGIGDRLLTLAGLKRGREAAMSGRRVSATQAPLPAFIRPVEQDGTLLEAHGISKHFGPLRAVDDVHMALPARGLKVLIGPNGAGKTTFFNLLSGRFEPSAGRVMLSGEDVTDLTPDALRKRGVCRSFQIINLFQRLTVRENLRLGVQARHRARLNPWRSARSIAAINEETRSLVAFAGLEGLEDVTVADLSYGGQRLLEIAVALAGAPRVLLLDEPLAGLAAQERERVTALIERIGRDISVLMVEHDIDRAFAFADRITVMHGGRVLVDGSPQEVRDHDQVQEVYLGRGAAVDVKREPRRPVTQDQHTVLELHEVNTFYGKSHILHDVSMECRNGEILGLLGRNGAGKSSTIKTVMGMVAPRSGRILFEGAEITGRPPETVARLGIGLVPQGRRLFGELTARQNLQLGGMKRRSGEGVIWDDETIFRFFPKIPELLDRKAGALSGGEQQMVAIARAMSGRTRLLLMDEPFEGLAPAVVDEVFDAIDRLRELVPVIIIEHDLDRVLALSDRVYVLDRGYISHEGPAHDLLVDQDLRRRTLWV